MKKTGVLTLFLFLLMFIFFSCQMNFSSVDFSMSEITVIDEPEGIYYSGYWPDGKLNLVKDNDKWNMFWGEAIDIKTVADSTWPEDHYSQVIKKNIKFGKGYSSIKNFNENGSWFIGVFPVGTEEKYIGFFHGESHWNQTGIAYKSIGVAYSNDKGETWEDVAPIIVDTKVKPLSPEWSGLGDGTVIWDHLNQRWICYYQAKDWNFAHIGYANRICMAVSYDEFGASGTWEKWDGRKFSKVAYNSDTKTGGENHSIKGLDSVPGCNPSVMWNSYLNKWIMVYGSWNKEIYISFSDNAVNWAKPKKILGSSKHPVWYPNLISEEGDKTGGKEVRIYFSYDQGADGKRKMAYSTLSF